MESKVLHLGWVELFDTSAACEAPPDLKPKKKPCMYYFLFGKTSPHLVHICGDEDVTVLHGMFLFRPLPNPCHSNVSLQFLRKPELASSLNLHIGQENVNSSKTLPFLFLGIDGLQLIIYYDMFHLSKELIRFRGIF